MLHKSRFVMLVTTVALVASAMFCSLAFGQSKPASTAAATSNTGFVLPANDGKWHTVLSTTIKNPTADDDLFIDVSQVDRITTTNATSSATPSVISSGDAKLEMRVLVDGITAKPGAIVFDEQLSTLTSTLQAFLSLTCTQTPTTETFTTCVCNSTSVSPAAIACDPAPAPVPTGYTRTCTTQTDHDIVTTCNLVSGAPQTLATLLGETIGHSFDFFAPGVGGAGATHTIQVQEMLTQTTSNAGTAAATIGPSTLKIAAVNVK
jgi:hypothetical protein